jgi:hypothetical protein
MLVHLRNRGTKRYYAGGGKWAAGPPPGLGFRSIPEALLYSRQEALTDMEVVLLHSNSLHKVVLPVSLGRGGAEHSNYAKHPSQVRV